MNASEETTLIVGSGFCAEQVAVLLAAAGHRLLVVTDNSTFPFETGSIEDDRSLIEVMTNTTIHACRQTANEFRLNLISGNNRFSRTVAGIVVAEPERRKANFSLYHLQPSTSVMPLSRLTGRIDQ